jgi:hypothetical protein
MLRLSIITCIVVAIKHLLTLYSYLPSLLTHSVQRMQSRMLRMSIISCIVVAIKHLLALYSYLPSLLSHLVQRMQSRMLRLSTQFTLTSLSNTYSSFLSFSVPHSLATATAKSQESVERSKTKHNRLSLRAKAVAASAEAALRALQAGYVFTLGAVNHCSLHILIRCRVHIM